MDVSSPTPLLKVVSVQVDFPWPHPILFQISPRMKTSQNTFFFYCQCWCKWALLKTVSKHSLDEITEAVDLKRISSDSIINAAAYPEVWTHRRAHPIIFSDNIQWEWDEFLPQFITCCNNKLCLLPSLMSNTLLQPKQSNSSILTGDLSLTYSLSFFFSIIIL